MADSSVIMVLVLIGSMTLLLFGINIYLLRLYIHPQDKRWNQAPYAKVIVILTLTFCQAQALLIPLDVVSKLLSQQTNFMYIFWMSFYLILFVFLCIFVPYALLFYQSDPEETLGKRLSKASFYLLLALIVPGIIVGLNMIEAINLRKLNADPFPLYQVDFGNLQPPTQKPYTYGELQVWQPLAIIQLLTFVGWFFVVFFAGVGLFALPADFINQFRFRPKVKKSNEMKAIKNKLIKNVHKLIKQGQDIKQDGKLYQNNSQAGFCQLFKSNRKVNSKFTQFKVKYHTLCDAFTLFNLQLKLSDTNPIIPFVKLVIGIIFLITSFLWIGQIILINIFKDLLLKEPLTFFGLDGLLMWLDSNKVNLLSTAIFAYFCLYMMWCVQKGSIKLGIRLPFCCRFYPLKEKGTTMNGLLMNCIYLILGSVGVTQLCVSCFPQYTRNSEAKVIFQQFISRMGIYSVFYKKGIFPIALLSWTMLSLFYTLITCNRKPAYLQQIDNIRKDHLEQLQLSQTQS